MNMVSRKVKSIVLRRRRVDYSLRFSSTAQRCRIRVNPAGVEVVLPRHSTEERATAFLREHSAWVLEQLAFLRRMGSLRARPKSDNTNSILLRGRPTKLEIVGDESKRRFGMVEQNGDRLRIKVPGSGAVNPIKTLENWLRRQARVDIEACLGKRCQQMKQRRGRVYIMGQRTKWGGCSARRNLSFNWRLVMAPQEVLDYLVIHELAHLAEPSHSSKFWLIVRSHCPGYARHKAWLKDHEHSLRLPFQTGSSTGTIEKS